MFKVKFSQVGIVKNILQGTDYGPWSYSPSLNYCSAMSPIVRVVQLTSMNEKIILEGVDASSIAYITLNIATKSCLEFQPDTHSYFLNLHHLREVLKCASDDSTLELEVDLHEQVWKINFEASRELAQGVCFSTSIVYAIKI